MKKLLFGLLVFGFATQFLFSQKIELSENHLDVNCEYLDAIESIEVAKSVKLLEKEVTLFNLKDAEFYSDEFENYKVSFKCLKGNISATFDKDGKILTAVERFQNVRLPSSVYKSIIRKFPSWKIAEGNYKVSYNAKNGFAKKIYKIKLENETKERIVKLDSYGEFL